MPQDTPTTDLSQPRRLVIMPAFNESASIGHIVQELLDHLPGVDVLVVDDGSTDNTATAVPNGATVVSLPFNLGIGGAMQTGYRYAAINGYDFAIQVDADGQHPRSEVPTLIQHMNHTGADVVIGSRFLHKGGYEQSFTRMTGIRLLGSLLRLLTGKKITDCTSGFRVVNRRVIHAYAYWYPDDYPEPEVILLLLRHGFRVEECSVTMNQRLAGETSIPFWHGLFYVVKVSVALVLDTLRHPWPRGKVELP